MHANTISEPKAALSKLIVEVAQCDQVAISLAGTPVEKPARLSPESQPHDLNPVIQKEVSFMAEDFGILPDDFMGHPWATSEDRDELSSCYTCIPLACTR